MPRKAKPYPKDGWWVTSVGGVQHRKLCPLEQGERQAEIALARLIVALEDIKRNGGTPTDTSVGDLTRPAPLPPVGHGMTVADAYNEFMNMKKVETDRSTYEWYRAKLEPFGERFANAKLANISYNEGLKYKEWLRREKEWMKGKAIVKGLSNTTVNAHIRAAKTFLEWACKPSRRHLTGLMVNPFEEIKYLVEKPRERLITPEEMAALLKECTDGNVAGGAQDFRDQLIVLRFSTLRPGELREMKWDYIDFTNHRIVFPPDVIKTRRRREVVLIDAVKDTLLARKARVRGKGSDFVFPGPGTDSGGKRAAGKGNTPVKGNSLSQRFRRLFMRCVKKGLIEKEKSGERIVPYSTRHLRISELFMEGHSLPIVMADAGHAHPQTTQRYTHLGGSFIAEQIRSTAPHQITEFQEEQSKLPEKANHDESSSAKPEY